MKIGQLLVLLACCFCLFPICEYAQLKAQTYQYTFEYDDCGNRVGRTCIQLSSSAQQSQDDALSDQQKSSLKEAAPEEEIAGTSFKLYPNPTDGELILEIQGQILEERGKINVFDISGKVVISNMPIESYTVIDLSAQPEGNYYLSVTINSETKTYKILKQ